MTINWYILANLGDAELYTERIYTLVILSWLLVCEMDLCPTHSWKWIMPTIRVNFSQSNTHESPDKKQSGQHTDSSFVGPYAEYLPSLPVCITQNYDRDGALT